MCAGRWCAASRRNGPGCAPSSRVRSWPTRSPSCGSRRQEVAALRARATTRIEARLHRAADQAEHLRRQVVALSPQSTLERGYAVVQHRDGRIVMDQDDVGVGELLRVRVARGDFGVRPVTAGADDRQARS